MLGARRWGDEEADEVSERQTEVSVKLDEPYHKPQP